MHLSKENKNHKHAVGLSTIKVLTFLTIAGIIVNTFTPLALAKETNLKATSIEQNDALNNAYTGAGYFYYADTGARVDNSIAYTAGEGLPFYKDTKNDVNDREIILRNGYFYYADTGVRVDNNIAYTDGEGLPYYKDTKKDVGKRSIVFGPTEAIPFYLDTGVPVDGNICYADGDGLPYYKDTMKDVIKDRKVVLRDGYYCYADTGVRVEGSIAYGDGDGLPYYKDTMRPITGRPINISYGDYNLLIHADGSEETIISTEIIVPDTQKSR